MFNRQQDGDCVYGSYCSDGLINYYDGYYCFFDKTTIPVTTTEPPTTTPIEPFCAKNGIKYKLNQEMGR